jgi:hypothetical protein
VKGLRSTSYLTRGQLNKIFKKKLKQDEIDEFLFSGKLIKRYSYYQPTEELLRELGVIPSSVKIDKNFFNKLAKETQFVLRDIALMFGGVGVDTAKIIAEKYFYRKYNYFYKKDEFNELILEGQMEYDI